MCILYDIIVDKNFKILPFWQLEENYPRNLLQAQHDNSKDAAMNEGG